MADVAAPLRSCPRCPRAALSELSVAGGPEVEICSECHPFYTGQQKIVDTAGRVERFRKKYEKFSAKQ